MMGLIPVAGLGGSASGGSHPDSPPLLPGSAVSALLVLGAPFAVRGEVVRMARQVAYGEATVRDGDGELVSRATGTFLLHRPDPVPA